MKKINLICILAMLIGQVHAEPTPEGGTPTYTNENGGFTYYNLDGSPVAPGTRAFISPYGGGMLLDSEGRTIGTIFSTPAEAEAARNAKPDCSGAVFGPGPSGDPCKSGSSGASASGVIVEIDEDAYNEKVFELNAVLFGATEIAAKSCKPTGEKMAGSLDSWFSAVKTYSLGETNRDKKLNSKIDEIQKKIAALATGASTSKDLQVESIQLQIETVSASINSISGAGGRIPLREALIVAALASSKSNSDDNVKTVKAFKDMVDISFVASVNAAKAACERKKKVEECEVVDEVETCKTVEKPDPVPGCDVALAQIPVMRAGPAQFYGEVYISKMPSTALNDRLKMFEDQITEAMQAIPKSNDANYDWSSPMENGFKVMKTARIEYGAKCPEGPKDPNKLSTKELNVTANEIMSKAAASFLEKIGAPENSKETADAFKAAWSEADKVVGQAAYRSEYFDMVKGKVNTVLAIDKQKLSNLQITKAKLEKYLTDIKTMLANTANKAGNKAADTAAAATTAAAAAKNAANTLALASTGGKFLNQAGNGTVKINAATAAQGQMKTVALDPNKNVSFGAGFNGAASTFGTKTLSTSSGVGDLALGAQSMAIAKKSMEGIAANQKKLNSVISSSSNGTGSSGNSGSAPANSNGNNNDLFAKMFDALSKSKAGSATSFETAMDKALDKVNESPNANEIYKTASAAGSKYYDAENNYSPASSSSSPTRRFYEKNLGYSSPSTSSSATPDSRSSGTHLSGSSGNSLTDNAGSNDRSVSSDARTISQTIAARKTKNKDTFVANDEDSLFERVTKAYIRNYEKIEDTPAK